MRSAINIDLLPCDIITIRDQIQHGPGNLLFPSSRRPAEDETKCPGDAGLGIGREFCQQLIRCRSGERTNLIVIQKIQGLR